MPDFDLTCEPSLKIELHMLRPITEKVHSGNGPVSLVVGCEFKSCYRQCVVNLGKSLYLACSFDPSTLGIWICLGEYHYLSADRFARPCLLKIPAVLQITLLKIFRCAVGVYFVSLELCMTLSDLGGLKIAHLKTILGVWLCAIALACLKRQGLVCTNNWPLAANSLLKGKMVNDNFLTYDKVIIMVCTMYLGRYRRKTSVHYNC